MCVFVLLFLLLSLRPYLYEFCFFFSPPYCLPYYLSLAIQFCPPHQEGGVFRVSDRYPVEKGDEQCREQRGRKAKHETLTDRISLGLLLPRCIYRRIYFLNLERQIPGPLFLPFPPFDPAQRPVLNAGSIIQSPIPGGRGVCMCVCFSFVSFRPP